MGVCVRERESVRVCESVRVWRVGETRRDSFQNMCVFQTCTLYFLS